MYIDKLGITKLTSRILLLVFLYNSIGYFLIFKCLQSSIQKEITESIQSPASNKLFKVLSFHKKDLKKINWVEDEKEMRYNGELYDIAKITETADSIIYYCINDEDEDQLYSQLDDHLTNHVILTTTHSSKKITAESIKLYFSNEHHFSFDLYSISFLPHISICTTYLPVYMEMNAPPPKVT
jgi:endonuclease III-like uncharacterized protein